MRVPKNLIMEVTSRCNLKCKYCPTIQEGAVHGDMDIDYFKSVIDRIDFDTIVVLFGNGEPLLYPHMFEAMKYVTDRDLKCYVTTNGMLWDRKVFDHVLEDNSLYQIIFSLDGTWETESIERARPGSNRQVIKYNIERFIDLKVRKKSKVDIGIKICKRGQDYEEIQDYIAYWLQYPGVDYVCVGDALIDDTGGIRSHPCQYFDDMFMIVRWDRKMVLCMYNDYVCNQDKLPLGELDEVTPLLEAYNSDIISKYRRDQRAGYFPWPCSSCGFPYTGSGFRGILKFRDDRYGIDRNIYYHQDYYNQFFSFKEKNKEDDWYGFRL